MNSNAFKVATIFAILLFMPISGCASGEDRRGRKQGPPPEAIKACEGKAVGDGVTFSGRRGESLKANCKEIEGQLVAVPEGMDSKGGKPE